MDQHLRGKQGEALAVRRRSCAILSSVERLGLVVAGVDHLAACTVYNPGLPVVHEEITIDELLYLSLGPGKHVQEVSFSLRSAARFAREDAGWRAVLYTDRPELFDGAPAELRLLEPSRSAEWAGPHAYVYRSKILALAEALAQDATTRAVIVDGDTWFRRSPEALFARLSPGTALMHVVEGRPYPPERKAVSHVLARHTPVDLHQQPWRLSPEDPLYNSGVVGLHVEDAELCREALHLTDQLLDHGFQQHSHTAEMVALGVVLAQRCRVRESFDLVEHYWPEELRQPFLARLSALEGRRELTGEDRFRALWPHRPVPSLKRRWRFRAKRLARRLGARV